MSNKTETNYLTSFGIYECIDALIIRHENKLKALKSSSKKIQEFLKEDIIFHERSIEDLRRLDTTKLEKNT